MINIFCTSLKLKTICWVNKILNKLKKNSVIGNDISYNLYKNKNLKIFGLVIYILKSIIELFGGKLFLIFFILGIILGINGTGVIKYLGENVYLHIFLFLSIIECYARF